MEEQLTFFEITFLVACLCASSNDVDVFIVETGLGGRYDATRILPADVSVVTSLSLEHRDILGDTLAEIAAEKAAIARPGKPLIVRFVDDSAAIDAIEYEAKHAGRSELGEVHGTASIEWISIPKEASFDEEATLLAQATLQSLNVDAEGLQRSQALLNWPAVYEIAAPWDGSILFDAAHNPSGLLRMLPQLQARIEQEPLWTLVLGCTPQHDLTSFVNPLIELCHQHPPESIVLTKPQLGRYPGVDLETLRRLNWPASCTILEQEDAAATSDCLNEFSRHSHWSLGLCISSERCTMHWVIGGQNTWNCSLQRLKEMKHNPELVKMGSKWDVRFLELANHISSWSKDPSTKVGCIIVGADREIRSTGFNGFPRGIDDSEERLTDREEKYPLICHAEENAIMHAARVGVSLKDCTAYVTWPPCTRCARSLIRQVLSKLFMQDLATFQSDGWRTLPVQPT